MKIVRARLLGFCMGVKRAVEAAEAALEENARGSSTVFTLGPLIHNDAVLRSLKERGAEILDASSAEKAGNGDTVIIRAHGTTPEVASRLAESGAKVIDATCPRVHQSQKRAAEWAKKGFAVIIAGDRNHGEVASICGYAEGRAVVIETAAEAEQISIPEKSILIAQTTFSPSEFEQISRVLCRRNPGIQVFNSICPATSKRQDALRELEGTADGILVIGGKNSANTRRLFETAANICGKAALIETAEDIPGEFLAMETVGITAGASTPGFLIDEAESFLRENSQSAENKVR